MKKYHTKSYLKFNKKDGNIKWMKKKKIKMKKKTLSTMKLLMLKIKQRKKIASCQKLYYEVCKLAFGFLNAWRFNFTQRTELIIQLCEKCVANTLPRVITNPLNVNIV